MPEPDRAKLLAEMVRAARQGGCVTVNLFLADDGAEAALAARRLVDAAHQKGEPDPVLGKVSDLARMAVATVGPETLQRLAASPDVASIMPAELDDPYPKPVRRGGRKG
jgi:hypothetical protein